MTTYSAASAQIRADLRQLPGARICGINGCQVITQGGDRGLREHRQVCHATDQWVRVD